MPAWTCPECGRRFGARNRGHTCEPGMTADQFFAEGHAHLRPVYDALVEGIDEDVIVEPVQVGIFFKGTRNFAELRPKRDRRRRDRFVLSLVLRRRIEHPRVRSATRWSESWVHHIDLYEADDVDENVKAWFAESADTFAL